MQTQNGQPSEKGSAQPTDPAFMSEALMASLRELILSFDHREMVEALKLVHDTTLYFSDITLEEKGEIGAFSVNDLVGGH